MKSIIASLFTIYALTSGNRLLLQGQATTGAPQGQATTGAPQGQATTGVPQQQGQGQGVLIPLDWIPPILLNMIPPTLPNVNAVSSQTIMEGLMEILQNLIPPTLPNSIAAPSQTIMECLLPITNPKSCAGRETGLQNAANNFIFNCGANGACAASTLNFTYVNSNVERVESILCSEPFSCYRGTVILDSTQSVNKQSLNNYECKDIGSCNDALVQLIGGASINNVKCSTPANCANCKIEVCEWDPKGSRQLLCDPAAPCFGY